MALGKNAQLEYGREVPYLDQKDSYLGSILRRVIDSINQVATASGVAAVGKFPVPPKVDAVNVQGTQAGNVITCPSEILHWTLTHNQSVDKNIRYFSEIDTSPQFPQPHIIDHGTSRTGITTLPTFSSVGTRATYYLRSYAQYPGSEASKPTVVGNLTGATQINMTGTSVTALLPSTGSGTASPKGTQGGQGLGVDLTRQKPVPKRNVS